MVVAKFANTTKHGALEDKTQTHMVDYYNLNVIISVGYRVKSKNGVAFRKWANKILKGYLIKGYTVNEKRLKALEKTIELIDIANRLDDYDHKTLKIKGNNKSLKKIDYEECMTIINTLTALTLLIAESNPKEKDLITASL